MIIFEIQKIDFFRIYARKWDNCGQEVYFGIISIAIFLKIIFFTFYRKFEEHKSPIFSEYF